MSDRRNGFQKIEGEVSSTLEHKPLTQEEQQAKRHSEACLSMQRAVTVAAQQQSVLGAIFIPLAMNPEGSGVVPLAVVPIGVDARGAMTLLMIARDMIMYDFMKSQHLDELAEAHVEDAEAEGKRIYSGENDDG